MLSIPLVNKEAAFGPIAAQNRASQEFQTDKGGESRWSQGEAI